MAHRLLSTARKVERLLWNGVKRGSIDTNLVSVFISSPRSTICRGYERTFNFNGI